MNDKVTVLIPTFNCDNTLDRSIESVLNQTYNNIEIIVINDCSTDKTKNILQKYNNNNIKIIHNSKNYGKFISVNIGIQNSNGKYITILDSDDIFHYDKIRQQVTVFNLFENCVANFHNIEIYNIDNNKKIRNIAEISIMFNKKIILNSVGYYHSNRFGSDTEFKDRLFKYFDKNRLININKILYSAYKRENSLTTSKLYGLNTMNRKFFEHNYKKWHLNTKNLYISFQH